MISLDELHVFGHCPIADTCMYNVYDAQDNSSMYYSIIFPRWYCQVPADWCEVAVGTALSAGRGDSRGRDGTRKDNSDDCLPGWTQCQQSEEPRHKVGRHAS